MLLTGRASSRESSAVRRDATYAFGSTTGPQFDGGWPPAHATPFPPNSTPRGRARRFPRRAGGRCRAARSLPARSLRLMPTRREVIKQGFAAGILLGLPRQVEALTLAPSARARPNLDT